MKSKLLLLSLALVATLASCGGSSHATGLSSSSSNATGLSSSSESSEPAKEYLKSWNECSALTSLKNFVVTATDEKSDKFIPVKDRIAVFDMDGTLYGELFPTYLEYLMYVYRVKEDPAYKDKADEEQIALADYIIQQEDSHSYQAGTDVRHGQDAAKAYAGMTLKEFKDYCVSFFSKTPDGFEGMTYGTAFYEPMKEVVEYLHVNDFQVYVVSGSDRYICRNLCCDYLNIPENRIIGMDVSLYATDQGETAGVDYTLKPTDTIYRGDQLVIKNLKFNKVNAIIKEIGKQPVLSFGNSGGDTAMHVYTKTNNKYQAESFMLVADDATRDYGVPEKAAKLVADWKEKGFQVVSMKDHFKTIYKPGAKRTERVR